MQFDIEELDDGDWRMLEVEVDHWYLDKMIDAGEHCP
jgi:hypothetical protein